MNKLSLQWLVGRIAETNPEISASDIADFARSYFEVIKEAVKAEGSISISGFGTFSSAPDGNIIFHPDSVFSDEVNLPFAYFEPVAIDDEQLASQLEDNNEEQDKEKLSAEEEINKHVTTPVPQIPDSSDPSELSDEPEAPSTETEAESESSIIFIEKEAGFPWLWVIIFFLFGGGLGYVIGSNFPYYDRWTPGMESDGEVIEVVEDIIDVSDIDTIIPAVEPVEQPAEVVPEARPAEVYDTVGPRRYLTTISRRHFGSPDFWPYIYIENKERAALGNPDLVPPKTVLVIPPASKYSIDAANPESVAAAKREAARIYQMYKKK